MLNVYRAKQYFNPHSHEGSDADDGHVVVRVKISIHTPTKGVTLVLRRLGE